MDIPEKRSWPPWSPSGHHGDLRKGNRDKKQTFESLRHLTIEETYELGEAILEGTEEVGKEVGDLMLHMVFTAGWGQRRAPTRRMSCTGSVTNQSPVTRNLSTASCTEEEVGQLRKIVKEKSARRCAKSLRSSLDCSNGTNAREVRVSVSTGTMDRSGTRCRRIGVAG